MRLSSRLVAISISPSPCFLVSLRPQFFSFPPSLSKRPFHFIEIYKLNAFCMKFSIRGLLRQENNINQTAFCLVEGMSLSSHATSLVHSGMFPYIFSNQLSFLGLNKVNWVEKRLKSCENMSKICEITTKQNLGKHSTAL